jgi:hypothetical protein
VLSVTCAAYRREAGRRTPPGPTLLSLHVRADDAVPLLGDDLLRRALIFQLREDRLLVGLRGRKLLEQLRRNLLALHQVLEADRVAIALQPGELPLVRIEIFHPQLGGVRVRGIGADGLHIDAGDHAGLRHHDLDVGVALQGVAVGQRVIVPADDDRSGALGERCHLADHWDEVALRMQLLEELEALLPGVRSGLAALGQARGIDAENGLVGGARIARERDRVLVVLLQKVGPILRRVLHDVLVHLEGQHPVVVAVPMAVRILQLGRDGVPGRDLVGLDQSLGLGGGTIGEADVDDVRRLRALVVLVGLDGFDLVAGARIRVQLIDLDAVFVLEALQQRAVAAPVVRQRDGGELPFLLGGGDQRVHRFRRDDRARRQKHHGGRGQNPPRHPHHLQRLP